MSATSVLNRNPRDYHNEVEQVAFGTGVLVDGIDFSEDKLLQGRTFAYSDTQRYRVGPNYLQLPINAPRCPFATNQRGGQMSYRVDDAEQGADPHVNYEPSNFNGLREQERAGPPPRLRGSKAMSAARRSSGPTTSPRRASATAASRTGSARS
jgi:catalase